MNKINGLRFIVGNGCNYNCFYCHHEGYYHNDYISMDEEKIKKLFEFTKNHNIKNISITGGEPLLYWENVKMILKYFDDIYYRKTFNTNASLINKYIDDIKNYNQIEFHVNLSSLNTNTHQLIINAKYLRQVLNNLDLLKDTHHKICLNIPVLKNYNLNELRDLYNYAKEKGFIPRFLVLMPVKDELNKNVATISEIINEFDGGKVIDKYSYGIYKAQTPVDEIEITKCLCDDMECEMCKQNTYMHLTPNLDIKYCMMRDDTVEIDFRDDETILNSFKEANARLEMIKR